MPAPSQEYAEPPVLVIKPDSVRTLGLVGDLWAYRDLLWSLADRDLRLRYRHTVLGVAWVVLQPLLGALIFTFVFGIVAGLPSDGVPYFRFTFASLAGWGLFAGIVNRASASLVQNSGLIAKVWFPRAVLPASTVPAALLDFAVALVVLLAMMVAAGTAPGAAFLLAPLWALALVLLALGLFWLSSFPASRPRHSHLRRPFTRACGGTLRPDRNRAGASTSRTRATRSSPPGSPTTPPAKAGGFP